jgi:succinoglycan biosynthesis protein ExoL
MPHVGFFATDIAEASQIRRIQSIRSLGHEVVSVSFRRDNMNKEFRPDWPDVPLGTTRNNRFPRRIAGVAGGLSRAFRRRAELGEAEVWIARNLDMLALAWALRLVTGRREVRLVYECLDIHSLMTRPGAAGAAIRLAERALLARTALLVVSSPAFVSHYFEPVQGYRGPVSLLENKLWLGPGAPARPGGPPRREGPLVLGWVGSLRCPKSLGILCETADRLGDGIRIAFHGNVHAHALPDFEREVARRPNIVWHGAYSYPGDLEPIYRSCDLVWAQDLWQAGGNSDWLLPNRIYEAGYFGCPSIALDGTETGRRVAADGLGFTVASPTADALCGLIEGLDRSAVRAASARLLAMPGTAFRLDADEIARALAPVLDSRRDGLPVRALAGTAGADA